MIIRDAGVQQRKSKLNSPRREELLRAPGSSRLRPDNTRVDENIPSSPVRAETGGGITQTSGAHLADPVSVVEIIILPNTVAEIYRRWTKTMLWLTWHEY